jgi:uncharacterized lipoprotein YajG
MKKFKWILLMGVSMFLFSSLNVNAQKIKVTGDFTQLKGQTSLNVEYVYDNLKVGKKSEDEYTKGKVADYNKDEPGKGDTWLINWKNDRINHYQPKFEELMNKYLNEKGIKVGADPNAKYTVSVRTLMIEPGYNVGVMRMSASIDVDISFVETTDKSADIATVNMTKVPGADVWGYDFDVAQRISEAYAKCGKELAKVMLKKGLQ